ncbi:MAG TPA: repressor LexA [Treponema sp.]|nr:repressor LexA [Treponema sp.]
MKNLTDRQKEVLDFIAQFTEENVFPPTVREIGDHFQISLRAVQDHIAALQKKGVLAVTQKHSRSLRVLKDMRSDKKQIFTATVPVVNSLLAGKKLFTAGNVAYYITLSEPFVSSGNSYFCMIIQDQSLTGAGIYPGDCLVFVQSDTSVLSDGEIVAAVIEGGTESLIRRYFKEESRVCLKADNPKIKTVYSQDLHVAGKLAAVLRTVAVKK